MKQTDHMVTKQRWRRSAASPQPLSVASLPGPYRSPRGRPSHPLPVRAPPLETRPLNVCPVASFQTPQAAPLLKTLPPQKTLPPHSRACCRRQIARRQPSRKGFPRKGFPHSHPARLSRRILAPSLESMRASNRLLTVLPKVRHAGAREGAKHSLPSARQLRRHRSAAASLPL